MTMTFDEKARVLRDLYLDYSDDADFSDFFDIYDVGVPAAYLYALGYANPTDDGKRLILATFDALCEHLGVDKYGNYESAADMIEFAES